MDLNLAELGANPEAGNLCGTVMEVLKQIISENGGPYLLVFWTQVVGKADAVKTMLYERLDGIPLPIAIVELAKGPFMVKTPKDPDFQSALREFYSELHNNIEELQKAVTDAVGKDPQLCALSSWESRASNAAARAANEIYACANDDVEDPTRTADAIQKVLAKIAVAASGKNRAIESPARALDAGMVDILADQFGISVEDAGYQLVIQKAIGETVKAPVAFQNDVRMFADLNTFFHVDTGIGSAKAGDRGVVISATPFNKSILGFRTEDLLTSEFLFPVELFTEDRRDEIKALLEVFRKSAKFVLVELGADCDYAQDTARTRRYLLGLEVPVKFFELAHFHENNKLRNESLQLLGPWNIAGEIIYLLVSCGRFWTWQEKKPHEKSEVKYRLRSSVVNKLLHHYSVWSSRPGIVEFR